jgi:acetoacetyl-CoA reductase/3-oxoacyl-[acyl-carrier protein] reductase
MHDPWDFTARTAIVTGGARGIGRSIAETLAGRGAAVQVFDVGVPEVGRLPEGCTLHAVDITDPAAVNRAVAALAPPPTLLVNNAGITRDRSLVKMSDAEWQAVIAVNLTGAFNLIRAVVPAMTAAGAGRIVNIASINGLRGKFGQANYSAAKAGLIGLTKTAARELGRKAITVNAIAPGMVDTPMTRTLPQPVLDQALADTVVGRLTTPEDVAYAVLFLLSDAAGAITGEVIRVAAGQYI